MRPSALSLRREPSHIQMESTTPSANQPLRMPASSSDRAVNDAIQGLRGIAIALVLFNHAGVPGFSGGYVGVDVFFVISGYLIGGHLMRELSTHGRIDLWAFYARRCRRLLPACLAVLLVVMGAVLWLYAPFEHRELMSSVRASSVYALNLWLAGRATDYFGGHTEAIPVLHLWSLAVEEQFYILWPLLMLGAVALWPGDARRSTWRLVIVAGIISLVACLVVSDIKFQWAFYLTPTRVWEFCAGMLIAARPLSSLKFSGRALATVGAASLLVLALTTILFDSQLRFPSGWAIIPVAAATGLVLVAEQRESVSWTSRLLRSRPLCWLGDCSYSVYLWHWPLIVFASVLYPRQSVPVVAGVVLLTLLLGWLSYRWIELPFKHGVLPTWSSRRVVTGSLTLCVAVAATAHVLGRLELDEKQARFREAAEWTQSDASGCLVLFDVVVHPACEFGSKSPTATVVLFGDSHAMQWFTPMRMLAERHGWKLVVMTKANCPAADLLVEYYVTRSPYYNCTEWRNNAFARIASLKPDLVVVAGSSGHRIPIDEWQSGIGTAVRRLQATGSKVAYVRDTPFANFNVPTCLARAQWRGLSPDALCTFPLAVEERRYGAMAKAEEAVVNSLGADFLDFPARICSQPNCPTEQDGLILFKDRNHITEAFALHLAPELERPLLTLLTRTSR